MAEQELQAALMELSDINAALDQFEASRDKAALESVFLRLQKMAPGLRDLSRKPECKSKRNAPMLVKLSNGMTDSVARVKQLGSSVRNTTNRPQSRESTVQKEINISPYKPSDDGPPLLRGSLRKLGDKGIKRWTERIFKQNGPILYYYANEGEQPKGNIDLRSVTTICSSQVQNGFDVVTPSRVYQLMAESESDQTYWMQGLNEWLNHLQMTDRMEDRVFSDNIVEPLPPDITEDMSEMEEPSAPQTTESDAEGVTHAPVDPTKASDKPPRKEENAPVDATKTNNRAQLPSIPESSPQTLEERENATNLERSRASITPSPTASTSSTDFLDWAMKDDYDPILDGIKLRGSSIGEQDDLSDITDPFMRRIISMERELRVKEAQIQRLEKKLHSVKELHLMKETQLNEVQASLKAARTEMKHKDEYIARLSSQLKEMRMQVTTSPLSLGRHDSSREELQRMRENSEAHQRQNAFLCTEIERIERESRSKLRAKDETITRLQDDLDEMTKRYQELRQQSMIAQGADIDELEEFDELKKDLFYSVAVGLKLNLAMRGQSCNIDIASLYEKGQYIDRKKWTEWIQKQMGTS